jgi:hypothetical protein
MTSSDVAVAYLHNCGILAVRRVEVGELGIIINRGERS